MEKRLFILSNRLPVCVDGEKGITPASGGLASAISSYVSETSESFNEVYWSGAPGCTMAEWRAALPRLAKTRFTYLPVFAPPADYEGYYNGFANSVLWPLVHYFP